MANPISNLLINIIGEFKDKGFKDAEKATKNLGKSFDKLAGRLGAALSVAAITKFSKASIKAFAEDDKAAKRLAQTYKNLGLSFQGAISNDYIDRLQRATGVADTQLRPALETITRATLDFNKSQEILNTALNVSAGSGLSLETVTTALSKAYLGQGTALGKLNIGIGQVESKTISFEDAISRLNYLFKGQAAAAANSYEGQLNRLRISADEAQETFGKHLVTAINRLNNNADLSGLGNKFEDMADNAGLLAIGIADVVGSLNKKVSATGADGWITKFNDFMSNFNVFTALQERGAGVVDISVKKRTLGAPGAEAAAKKEAELRKKSLADQKKLIALQKKAEEERKKREREALALKRANTIFDIDNIQVVAAMQQQVDGETRLRLSALLALQTDNAEAAEKLATGVMMLNARALESLGIQIKATDTVDSVIEKIIKAQTSSALLALGIKNLPDAKNPFKDWPDILAKILSDLDKIAAKIKGMPTYPPSTSGGGACGGAGGGAGGGGGGGNNGGGNPVIGNQPPTNPAGVGVQIGGNVANPFETFTVGGATIIANSGTVMTGRMDDTLAEATARQRIADIFATIGTFGAGGFNAANVTVNVAGNVMSNDDLIQVITEGLYEVQKRGQSITLNAVAL